MVIKMKDMLILVAFIGLYGYGYMYINKLTEFLEKRRKNEQHKSEEWK